MRHTLNKKTSSRLLSLLLAVVMMLSLLASCAGEGSDASASDSNVSEPTVTTQGIPEGYTFALTADYTVIRSEKAGANAKNASIELKNELCELFSKDIAISEDWRKPEDGALEILIGATNRPESEAAISAFGGEMKYSVSVSGKAVVIAAASDALIDHALEYFLNIIYFDSESGCAYLPAELNFVSESFKTLEIARGGKARYGIVYSNNVTDAVKAEYTGFQKDINDLLGSATQMMTGDTGKHDSDSLEILIGTTSHPENAEALALYDYDECGYAAVGNKIVIAGRTLPAALYAAERFLGLLKDCNSEGDILLPYAEAVVWEYEGGYPEIPAVSAVLTSAYDCGDKTVTLLYAEATKADYDSILAAAGYEKISTRDAWGESHAVLESETDGARLFVSFGDFGMRLTAEPLSLPTFPAQVQADAGSAELTLIQSALNYENTDENTNGMSYVLQLTDGSFVIWDGGFASDANDLYALLKEKAPAGEVPHIRMWILTHMHGDHQGCFLSFADRHQNDVVLDYFGLNAPILCSDHEGESSYTNGKLQKAISKFKGTKTVKLHSGMLLRMPGADIEVLQTQEDLGIMGLFSTKRNDQSVVTRILAKSESVLLPGDAEIVAGDLLVARYGEALKSTYVQIAHHGSKKNPTCLDFYKFSAPSYCFFPGAQERFKENRTTKENKYLIDLVGANNIYVADGSDKAVKLK